VFLITTADQRFWKTDEKVLFLGEWCKLYEQRSIWSKLDYQVLPYHWNNREKLYSDYVRLNAVYERYLKQLTDNLNKLHEVDHSLRYWRIIIGPWLYYFIQILHDRYLSIRRAAESGLVTTTWLTDPPAGRWTPLDFLQFGHWFVGDGYNHYLYGRVIAKLGQIPYQVVPDERLATNGGPPSNKSAKFKSVAKKVLQYYGRAIPPERNEIVLVDCGLGLRDLFKLQRSLGQWPYLSKTSPVPANIDFEEALRKKLATGCGENEFESLLDELIWTQLPKAYLEGYSTIAHAAAATFPRNAKLIFTEVAHATDEVFKFWAAEQVERGARLAVANHGGNYGTILWMSNEEH